MSLFDALLGAVNDPSQAASMDQLGGLVNVVQQVAGSNGLDPATTQTLMSMVGSAVQSGLQDHSSTHGVDATQNLVQEFSSGSNASAIAALIPPEIQAQVAGTIAERTGLDAGLVQSMLPSLIPVVLNMIQGGSIQNGAGTNPLLNLFLDSNRDGNLDVGDAMNLAMQFMQNR